MRSSAAVCLSICGLAAANLLPRQTPAVTRAATAPVAAAAAAAPSATAITECYLRGPGLFCIADETEYFVKTTPTATTNLPAEFTGCHHHGKDMYCVGPDGEEVEAAAAGEDDPEEEHHYDIKPDFHDEHDHDHDHESPGGSQHCHFHAGVEHCVGADEDGHSVSTEAVCEAPNRQYNVPLRVGLIFVIMATSAIGVFAPILLQNALPNKLALPLTVLKQFGTGIILSTAFVHLYTHSSLMFANKCVGNLGYESTTSAIVMAGLFLSFCVEYIGHRIVLTNTNALPSLSAKEESRALFSAEVVSILVMEAGILFHSLLIGLTLVVAGDTFFITLFIVIVFHQLFEGIALGTRIAALGSPNRSVSSSSLHVHEHVHTDAATGAVAVNANGNGNSAQSASDLPLRASSESPAPEIAGLPLGKQIGLASLFAFVTPIGMAIGIGVLQRFNGNDKATIIAIGTLDALSAGILIWVGVVEMWAADWMVGAHGHKAELADADLLTVVLAGFGLLAGVALMSLLGKWA